MKKKNYIKPTVKVIVLRHQGVLLVDSQQKRGIPDDEIDEYDDWFN